MIYNFGSINVDHVYRVEHLPAPGETIAASQHQTFLGGKGINQSIAISRAHGEIRHIGAIGPDREWVIRQIEDAGIKTDYISIVAAPTGHAIINVDDDGENAIVIFSGANLCLTEEQITKNLAAAMPQDWVLLQNETNLAAEICNEANNRGCKIAYSAAPFIAETTLELLPFASLLVLNEGEAVALGAALNCAPINIPIPELLVTCGNKGAWLRTQDQTFKQNAFSVSPVDTTGAGDTFLGSFLALYDQGSNAQDALRYAAAASALQVTKPGAALAIPLRQEVEDFLRSATA